MKTLVKNFGLAVGP